MMKRFPRKIKISPVLYATVALVLVLSVSVGAMYAYLKMTADEAKDNFTVEQEYPVAAAEALDDWCVQVGSTPVPEDGYCVYVRAAVNAMWKDSDGNVVAGSAPDGCVFTPALNTTGGWFQAGDGYYYYASPVACGETTNPLFTSVTRTVASGYSLTVNVYTQTVQAIGSTDAETPVAAVNDAWGSAVTVNSDHTLSASA